MDFGVSQKNQTRLSPFPTRPRRPISPAHPYRLQAPTSPQGELSAFYPHITVTFVTFAPCGRQRGFMDGAAFGGYVRCAFDQLLYLDL